MVGITPVEVLPVTENHAEPVHAVKVGGLWSSSIDYHISPRTARAGVCADS